MEKVAVIVPGEKKEDHKPYNLRFVILGVTLTNILIIIFAGCYRVASYSSQQGYQWGYWLS